MAAEVLIVGGGPVGLTLAADLSCRKVKTILLEMNPTTSDSPKAVLLNGRSMEHFRRMGLQHKMEEASYPSDLPVTFFVKTGLAKGKLIYSKVYPSWGDVASGRVEGSFPAYQHGASVTFPMMCPQFSSEAAIRKHIEDTTEHVQLFWGWRVTEVSQDDAGVTVKAVNESGEEKTFKAKYLVSCDGGRSFVRKNLGIHTFGKFVVARACTFAFRSPQLFEQMIADKMTGFGMIFNSSFSGISVLLNSKGDYAVHIIMSPSTTDKEVEWYVQNSRKVIERLLGTSDVAFEILSANGYNMHALMSTKFSVGRCFFAGDSAHQWLPAGGLGLNTGICDAGDLAWKLEAMLKGYGGKYLLDSYEIERRPLCDSTRRYALKLGLSGAIPNRVTDIVRQLMTRDPVLQFIIGKLFGSSIINQFQSVMDLIFGFQYSNSNIVLHQCDQDGNIRLPCNFDGKFNPSSLPGCRAPHVVLPDYPSTLDLFGKAFVLLTIGGVDTDLKELCEAMTEKGVPFTAHNYPPLPELTELYDRKYFLIRPDGIVAWRADFQPSAAESAKIVATALGHMPPTRLPPPVREFYQQGAPPIQSFARDVAARLLVTGFLIQFTDVSLVAAGAVGLGAFLLLRAVSVSPPPQFVQFSSRHKAAVIDGYGNADSMLRVEPRHVGRFGPSDVLIRVRAASVSHLDVKMRNGRGSISLQKLAGLEAYFPLILGRDCAGEVVAVGDDVTKYLPGDLVYAAIPPHRQGGHAQMVAVNQDHVSFKPSNVDYKEAASLPWVAVTVWTALVKEAGLNEYNTRGKKVLVIQGTGGPGSFAVQLLKAWGAHVTTTCPVEDTALAHHLGADKVVEDQSGDISSILSGYDLVLNTVGCPVEHASLSTLKLYRGATYISLFSPREQLVGSLGGFLGNVAFSTFYRFKVLFNRLIGGRGFYFSSTEVDGRALEAVRVLVEQGAVRPLIDAVYSLDEVIDAHKHVETGSMRGNVVLSIP